MSKKTKTCCKLKNYNSNLTKTISEKNLKKKFIWNHGNTEISLWLSPEWIEMILATENIFPIFMQQDLLYNLRSVRTQLSFFSWFSIVRIGNARTLGNKFKNEFKTLTSKCAAWDSWQNNAMEKSWLIGCPLVFNERTEEEQLNSLEQVVNKLFLKFCQTK